MTTHRNEQLPVDELDTLDDHDSTEVELEDDDWESGYADDTETDPDGAEPEADLDPAECEAA